MVSSKLRVTRATVRKHIHEAPSTQLEFGAGFRAGRETKIVYPRSRNPAGHDHIKDITKQALPPKVKRTDKKIKARSGMKGVKGISFKATTKKALVATPASKTDKPKRSLNAYMLFSQERRPQLVAKHPGLAFSEIDKKLGDKWRAMTAAAKGPYIARATKGPSREQGAGGKDIKETTKKAPAVVPASKTNKPKRSLNAYMLFSQERRPQLVAKHPGLAFSEIGKKLGEEWRAMTAADKGPYIARATKGPSREQGAGGKDIKETTKKAPAVVPASKTNKPKRSLNAYMLFSQERRPQLVAKHPGLAFSEIGKKLGEEWRAMTAAAKGPYIARANKAKAQRAS